MRLTGERADEAVAALARATRDGVTALEETRRMYEERLDASKVDCDARARAAEDRARTVEHERQRAETARQAANKELARLQVFFFTFFGRRGGSYGRSERQQEWGLGGTNE